MLANAEVKVTSSMVPKTATALLQDIELMPQCRISVSSRRRGLKQPHSMQTKWKEIAIIRRSCSDSLLTASQMDVVFGIDTPTNFHTSSHKD